MLPRWPIPLHRPARRVAERLELLGEPGIERARPGRAAPPQGFAARSLLADRRLDDAAEEGDALGVEGCHVPELEGIGLEIVELIAQRSAGVLHAEVLPAPGGQGEAVHAVALAPGVLAQDGAGLDAGSQRVPPARLACGQREAWHAEEREEGRHRVDERERSLDAARRHSRDVHHERCAELLAPRAAVRWLPVLAEPLAVIAEQEDGGALPAPRVAQPAQEPADLRILVAEGIVVLVDRAPA